MWSVEFLKIVQRAFRRVLLLAGTILVLVAVCVAYARLIEPTWLRVRHLKLSSAPTVRVIHISDIHYAGETQYFERVVATINGLKADFVCFTGDLIEDAAYLEDALHFLEKINKATYGVPGNHDRWALRSFANVRASFRKTGGDWLSAGSSLVPSKRTALMTLAGYHDPTPPGYKRILLEHQPDAVAQIGDAQFDLILAGHTHGGQVRIPFMHRCVLPFDLGIYDLGLFQTPCGPLYVNPGIGTFYWNMRFRCRPEITIIEI